MTTIDARERMQAAVASAKQAHEMVFISMKLDTFNPSMAVPETVEFWRTERRHWMESARFWRRYLLEHDVARDLHTVRDWIRGKHLLVYVRAEILRLDAPRAHCECCGCSIVYPHAAYYWSALEDGADALQYRLCGYCDVQAKVLANKFVRDLKAAIFDPEQAIAGWPVHRDTPITPSGKYPDVQWRKRKGTK